MKTKIASKVITVLSIAAFAIVSLVYNIAVAIYNEARGCREKAKAHPDYFRSEKGAKWKAKVAIAARSVLVFVGAAAYALLVGAAKGVLNAVHAIVDFATIGCSNKEPAKDAVYHVVDSVTEPRPDESVNFVVVQPSYNEEDAADEEENVADEDVV